MLVAALACLALAAHPLPLRGESACQSAASVPCRALAMTVVDLPPSPVVIGHVQISVQPGASYPDIVVPGPGLLVVTEGVATVDVPGETDEEAELEEMEAQAVWRQSPVSPVPDEQRLTVPQVGTFEFTLAAGDQITTLADVPHAIFNRGDDVLTLLAVAVTPPEPATGGPVWPPAGAGAVAPPDGVALVALDAGYRAGVTLDGSRARLTIDAFSLDPGTTGPVLESSVGLIAVPQGALDVLCTAATVARDGQTTQATPVDPSESVVLLGPAALTVADAATCSWSNDGDGPAEVIVVLVSTRGELGTPEPHVH